MNIPKLAERYLLLKNSLTRNIQQVFVTWKSLMMATTAMKTKGFMIRSHDEGSPKPSKTFLHFPKPLGNWKAYNFVITIFLGLSSHKYHD